MGFRDEESGKIWLDSVLDFGQIRAHPPTIVDQAFVNINSPSLFYFVKQFWEQEEALDGDLVLLIPKVDLLSTFKLDTYYIIWCAVWVL